MVEDHCSLYPWTESVGHLEVDLAHSVFHPRTETLRPEMPPSAVEGDFVVQSSAVVFQGHFLPPVE